MKQASNSPAIDLFNPLAFANPLALLNFSFDIFGWPLRLGHNLLSSMRLAPLRTIVVDRAAPKEFTIGDSAEMCHVFTHLDVFEFYTTTGDGNPIHTNDAFANDTKFQGPIAHGMDVGSMFSTILASSYPGVGTVYLYQDLSFLAFVRLGAKVTARVKLVELLEKNEARFDCVAMVDDTIVIKGTARVKLPKRVAPTH